ncbi:MAG: ArsI/CadI family heavy metal resistance metalloenzyme [Pseudomonadota bacterium]
MKRLHVSVRVDDLDASVRFYSKLFAAEPTVRKDDYASWLLDDPRVNFALSHCGESAGVDHLGLQADDDDELQDIFQRLETAGADVLDEGTTTCCYARSTKQWTSDPQGVRWEAFLTHHRTEQRGTGTAIGS